MHVIVSTFYFYTKSSFSLKLCVLAKSQVRLFTTKSQKKALRLLISINVIQWLASDYYNVFIMMQYEQFLAAVFSMKLIILIDASLSV